MDGQLGFGQNLVYVYEQEYAGASSPRRVYGQGQGAQYGNEIPLQGKTVKNDVCSFFDRKSNVLAVQP